MGHCPSGGPVSADRRRRPSRRPSGPPLRRIEPADRGVGHRRFGLSVVIDGTDGQQPPRSILFPTTPLRVLPPWNSQRRSYVSGRRRLSRPTSSFPAMITSDVSRPDMLGQARSCGLQRRRTRRVDRATESRHDGLRRCPLRPLAAAAARRAAPTRTSPAGASTPTRTRRRSRGSWPGWGRSHGTTCASVSAAWNQLTERGRSVYPRIARLSRRPGSPASASRGKWATSAGMAI
jgi:hypothetical protein